LNGREFAEVRGEKFVLSSRKLNPAVETMHMKFAAIR